MLPSLILDFFSVSRSLPTESGYFLDGAMHTFVWTIILMMNMNIILVGVFIALWILRWAVELFYHKTVEWLHSCMQSRALRADVDPAADDLEVPAAEEPAAGDCVTCGNCSNNETMHYSVKACPCCHEEILSSANSEPACTKRCDKFSNNVHDCDDGEQCTLHSNHSGECLFKFSDKVVESTDSEFEPEEDS